MFKRRQPQDAADTHRGAVPQASGTRTARRRRSHGRPATHGSRVLPGWQWLVGWSDRGRGTGSGSNFGSSNGYQRNGTLMQRDEMSDPRNATWRALQRNLRAAGIDMHRCFFSNAWPCLHAGNSNMNGLFPAWLRDCNSMRSLLAFLDRTLDLFRPRLVVALGPNVAAFLAQRWPIPLAPWSARNIRGLNALPKACLPATDGGLVVTAVLHPCLAQTNYRHRIASYNTAHGEAVLLRECREQAGLPAQLEAPPPVQCACA